jgi:hypothetical protein
MGPDSALWWSDLFPSIMRIINTSNHSALGVLAAKIVFGDSCNHSRQILTPRESKSTFQWLSDMGVGSGFRGLGIITHHTGKDCFLQYGDCRLFCVPSCVVCSKGHVDCDCCRRGSYGHVGHEVSSYFSELLGTGCLFCTVDERATIDRKPSASARNRGPDRPGAGGF